MKWLFSLRFSATDTHLVIEVDTETVKKKLDHLSQAYVNTTDMPLSDVVRNYYHYYPEGVEKDLNDIKQYADNWKYINVRGK